MKNAVLDPQAASRFSTAAALATKESGTHTAVDWRDNTLATRSPPREPQAKAVSPPTLAPSPGPVPFLSCSDPVYPKSYYSLLALASSP